MKIYAPKEKVKMAKTTIQVNSVKKVVNMTVAGRMTMSDAELFIKEYQVKIGPLNGPDFELEVDATDMQVLTPEMTENLTEVMKMYKKTGFKKVTVIITQTPVLKMQLSRIARNAGLTQFVLAVK